MVNTCAFCKKSILDEARMISVTYHSRREVIFFCNIDCYEEHFLDYLRSEGHVIINPDPFDDAEMLVSGVLMSRLPETL